MGDAGEVYSILPHVEESVAPELNEQIAFTASYKVIHGYLL